VLGTAPVDGVLLGAVEIGLLVGLLVGLPLGEVVLGLVVGLPASTTGLGVGAMDTGADVGGSVIMDSGEPDGGEEAVVVAGASVGAVVVVGASVGGSVGKT
jgi:hypothetical protein